MIYVMVIFYSFIIFILTCLYDIYIPFVPFPVYTSLGSIMFTKQNYLLLLQHIQTISFFYITYNCFYFLSCFLLQELKNYQTGYIETIRERKNNCMTIIRLSIHSQYMVTKSYVINRSISSLILFILSIYYLYTSISILPYYFLFTTYLF